METTYIAGNVTLVVRSFWPDGRPFEGEWAPDESTDAMMLAMAEEYQKEREALKK